MRSYFDYDCAETSTLLIFCFLVQMKELKSSGSVRVLMILNDIIIKILLRIILSM